MCSLADILHIYGRHGHVGIDCRGFIQLCRECGLSEQGLTDADAELIFVKVVPVARRQLDLSRLHEALRLVAEHKCLEENFVHQVVIASCRCRPNMMRVESAPLLRPWGSPTAGAGHRDPSKKSKKHSLPGRRRPKVLEGQSPSQEPPSCQTTPGGVQCTPGGLSSGSDCGFSSVPASPSGQQAKFGEGDYQDEAGPHRCVLEGARCRTLVLAPLEFPASAPPSSPARSSTAVAEDDMYPLGCLPTLQPKDPVSEPKAECDSLCGRAREDTLEEAFTVACGERQGMDANGFAALCKQCSILDQKFTAQDARLVFSEAVPVNQQRMDFSCFEAAVARIATRKCLDRGLLCWMVTKNVNLDGSRQLKRLDDGGKGLDNRALPVMSPLTLDIEAPSRMVKRNTSKFGKLRMSMSMPSLGGRARQPDLAEAVNVEVLPPHPLGRVAVPPLPVNQAASQTQNNQDNLRSSPRSRPSSPICRARAEAEAQVAAKNFWPAMPANTLPSGEARSLVSLICAR